LWNSPRHKLSIARRLSPADWLVLAEAWWTLLGCYLALRRMSFETLATPVNSTPDEAPGLPDQVIPAERTGRLLGLASRLHLLPMTCLVRALALRRMLERRGIPARLQIGAGKTLNGIQAHAWVEVQGQAIGEPGDIPTRFATFKSVM